MRPFFLDLKEATRNSVLDGSFSAAKGAAYSLILSFFPTLMVLSEILEGTKTTSALALELTHALDRVLPPTTRVLATQYFSGNEHNTSRVVYAALFIALFAGTGVTGSFIQGIRA